MAQSKKVRKQPGRRVSVVLKDADYEALRRIAAQRDASLSSLARAAVRAAIRSEAA